MKNYEKFYINGEWVDPIDGLNLLDVINPTTEESTIVIVGDRARLRPAVFFAFILNCSLPSVLPSLTIFSVKDPVLLLIVTL